MEISEDLKLAVAKYKTPEAAITLLNKQPPLIIAGVTASGKNTLQNYITGNYDYQSVITHTTRSPRDQEVNGLDYWFVSQGEMQKLLSERLMIEAKVIHSTAVNGTSLKAYQMVVDNQKRPVLDVDIQGVSEILKAAPQTRAIFIVPPSFDEWMERLHGRGPISKEDKARRLHSAKKELDAVLASPDIKLVLNKDIPTAIKEVMGGDFTSDHQAANRKIAEQLLTDLEAY